MLIGIGYAALTDVLDINGTADVSHAEAQDAFDEDIYFSKAVANPEGNTENVASIVSSDPDMANFTVSSLSGQGDKATFTFTIKNDGDLDATITPTFAEDGNTNKEYFHIESDWKGASKRLEAGKEITYTVTVTLLKTPTAQIHGSFHIELTAVSDEITTTAPEETTTDPAETEAP